MKRRDFSIHLAGTGLGLALAGSARAQGGPVEGTQYVRLQTAAPVSLPEGKKVEVVEFFWYECPHCYEFEPLLDSWSKRVPADVAFRRVPVGFTARHQIGQKIFYALEEMGQVGAMHRKVFTAIHAQGKRLLSESDIVAFMVANGLDGAKFTESFRSFSVATKANRAKQLSEAYKIDGVPAIGVQGRYYTSGALAGGHDRALAVADYLIGRARQGA
ncbi:thiol:disulfide interchange protein DsbA/DsbL [Rubrivivax gelatinosus]|uniref:Thiol:disulfide interchange protein n=1 Tax=Rubrivivax gelatinosus TaxID=28068 RepID=A0ABS1DXZ7_RUBGE|nr:thiol:disulfide interchange protein DsbA/DsbL [Rubrivivax gelatinosus]MBK1714614.1 disulfide bond formation protein DsbA [Rubrivivax gelatinosus]